MFVGSARKNLANGNETTLLLSCYQIKIVVTRNVVQISGYMIN